MDWTVYWFMLPACVIIASIAMFSGISGAAMLTPLFLIGFPLFGVPTLTAIQAIALALFLETGGFSHRPLNQVERAVTETVEHHAQVHLRAAA